eukprot:GHVP01053715.1.p1 GENE.GHVP01053715.1~~GHVP01053715.1.p1  ORF type:complete len:391 (+),score=50.93 GHVP01053715.1:288-1460(+)
MEDITFDFEEDLHREEEGRRRLVERIDFSRNSNETSDNLLTAQLPSSGNASASKVVCRHWMRGMCMKGQFCEYLHEFDVTKMPLCPRFSQLGYCHEFDVGECEFKHPKARIEEGPVCVHYFLGYCEAGPKCRKKHINLPAKDAHFLLPDWYLQLIIANREIIPDARSISSLKHSLNQIESTCRQMSSRIQNTTSNEDFSSHRQQELTQLPFRPSPDVASRGAGSKIRSQSTNFKPINITKSPPLDPIYISPPVSSLKQNSTTQDFNDCQPPLACPADAIPGITIDPLPGVPPLPQNRPPRIKAFIIKSIKVENICKSIHSGVWAALKNNSPKLAKAYQESDYVVLLFSANESGGFQGYARMASLPDRNIIPNKIWGSFSSKSRKDSLRQP